ncbi:hypothetical protein RRG08_062493 [Elysia crispata]|uniref:ABC transporter domain-containing protein n=1 Tax=Elysia crispata TaxID=231223 RepID=A0AAE1EAF4_9GAST|nr:hypothetical protein RRG08_062493 [Elysia crispata]
MLSLFSAGEGPSPGQPALSAVRVFNFPSPPPKRHRSYCDSNGNKFISESRASTPFSDGRTGSAPGRGDVHHEGAEMYTDLDEPSHSGNPSYVTVDKRAPQPPACLSVVGITYTVKESPGHWWNGSFLRRAKLKQVLHNLTMTFNKGELTALIGASGSGKTSLLDVISGRAEGTVEGVVSYKHNQCRRAMMRQKASYVLQADRLLSQ